MVALDKGQLQPKLLSNGLGVGGGTLLPSATDVSGTDNWPGGIGRLWTLSKPVMHPSAQTTPSGSSKSTTVPNWPKKLSDKRVHVTITKR